MLYTDHYHQIDRMTDKTWGGKRKGAGRPKLAAKRKLRTMKFLDEEWELIRQNAEKRGMSIREYLYRLAERDT